MPGVITCPGDGEGVGICIPGVITWPGLDEGEAVGICMPGVITCGGEGEGFGLVTLLDGGRLLRGGAFFFLGALFGFGFIFDMSCISCCGSAVVVTANTSANMIIVRNTRLLLPSRFIGSPPIICVRISEQKNYFVWKLGRRREHRPMPVPSVTSGFVGRLNAVDVD